VSPSDLDRHVAANGSVTGSSQSRDTPPSEVFVRRATASALSLAQSLPLPASNPNRLTQSQLLFQQAAGVDPRALRISSGEDGAFFLFMEMRLECQWVSYDMAPAKWIKATEEFNRRLAKLGKGKRLSPGQKHPRALMEKLAEIEGKVADRLYRNNFMSALFSVWACIGLRDDFL
jgi:hypothetical protein